MKVIKRFFVLAFFLGILLTACTSAKVDDSYYKANVGDFSTDFLDNSIPVVMKNTGRGQITVLKMVVEGGTPLLTLEKSGLEDITIDLMYHGSEKYSYNDIQQMEYDLSFSMSSSCSKDYSVIGFKCIDRDFETALDVLQDGFFKPIMSQEDFAQLINENNMSLARLKNDPQGVLQENLHKLVYQDHQYQASSTLTEDSIVKISLEDVKNHFETLHDAKRIKFVVVGNLSDGRNEKILASLNELFGKIPSKNYKRPVISPVKLNKKSVYAASEQAGEIGYAVGYFDAPERYDADYVPFAMALMFLDDEFFSYVREENSACYSIGTGILSGQDILGVISIFKSSKNKEIKKLVYDAISNFPNEKEIESKLENYKSKYITSLFSSSQNTSGVASNIVTSLEYSGDPAKYLYRTSEVQKVTATQILKAYKKYIAPKKITWVVVSSKDSLNEFEF